MRIGCYYTRALTELHELYTHRTGIRYVVIAWNAIPESPPPPRGQLINRYCGTVGRLIIARGVRSYNYTSWN